MPVVAALISTMALEACANPRPIEPPAAPPTLQSVPPSPPALFVPSPASPPDPGVSSLTPRAGTTPSAVVPATQDNGQPVLPGAVTHVVDGDTLMVRLNSGLITVRLSSIDAPEHDQPGGAEAKSALQRRLAGRQVEVQVETQDQYERVVAFIYLGGENINSWLVQQGYAWAYRQYMSDPQYCIWESDARAYRRGLWGASSGSQRAPWEWRRAQREGDSFGFTDYQRETVSGCVGAMGKSVDSRVTSSSPHQFPPVQSPAVVAPTAAGACRIKGNISESGRIYHVPGSETYERTQIDTRKGERWFCSEEEARAAGWRAPR